MGKIIFTSILVATLVSSIAVPTAIVVNNKINEQQVNSNNKQQINPVDINDNDLNLSYLFLNDIKNYNDRKYLTLDSSFVFSQITKKYLITLGIISSVERWDTRKEYKYLNTIKIDLNQMIFKSEIFPTEFDYTFIDPEPAWHDPVGARWNNKTKKIKNTLPIRIATKISPQTKWYGDLLIGKFNLPESEWIYTRKYDPIYPPHMYAVYGVMMNAHGRYYNKAINKSIAVKKINNRLILKAFLDKNLSFNSNITILVNLNKAKLTIKFLNDFIEKYTFKGVWTNQKISKEEVMTNIKNIQNLKFNDFFQLNQLIKSYEKNQSYEVYGEFSNELKKLNKNLHTLNLITNEPITIDNVTDFYETVLLFFKNNNIYINYIDNKIPTKMIVWNGHQFVNENQINLINSNDLISVEVEYLSQTYGSKEINDNWTILINNN